MLLAVVELGVVTLGEGRIDHCRDGTQTAKYNLLLVQVQSRQVAASFSTNQIVGGTDEVGREGGREEMQLKPLLQLVKILMMDDGDGKANNKR